MPLGKMYMVLSNIFLSIPLRVHVSQIGGRVGIAHHNQPHGFKFPLPIATASLIYGRRCLPYMA